MIESEDKKKHDNFDLISETKIIVNKSDIGDVLQSIYATITSNIKNL